MATKSSNKSKKPAGTSRRKIKVKVGQSIAGTTLQAPRNGRRTPKLAAGELPEKTKKLTLKAFRLAYESHNRKPA